MKSEYPGHDDIIRALGTLSDGSAKEILAFRPSWSDIEIVAAYLAGETDVMGEERKPLSGVVADILDIVRRDDLMDEERDR